jgi:DNA-binding beta-propeller fold protein YncE
VPVGILVAPSGRRAFIASTNADAISVLDLEQGQVVDVWQAGKEPDGLGYSPLPVRE